MKQAAPENFGLSQDSETRRGVPNMILRIDNPDGRRLVRPIGISPFPILMAKRPHCLRRLTARMAASCSDCDGTQVSRFVCSIRRGQVPSRLRHGPCRSLHALAMEVMAGLSLGTRTLRIRVSFYSAFKVQKRKKYPLLIRTEKDVLGDTIFKNY